MLDHQLDLFQENNEAEKKDFYYNKNTVRVYKTTNTSIQWRQLFRKLWAMIKVPLVAAKYQIITRGKNYYNSRPFPWFRLVLVVLFLYIFFKKDIQFDVNMGERSAQRSEASLAMGQTIAYTPKKNIAHKSLLNLNDKDVESYIRRFRKVALIEMQKFQIPASIKMGQAILASQAGKNHLSLSYNNHFKTPCNGFNNCVNYRQSNTIRKYESAWESWRDHSQLLSNTNYISLRKYGKNYKKWANGLEALGYNNTPNYAAQLIACIEKYELFQLDQLNENL